LRRGASRVDCGWRLVPANRVRIPAIKGIIKRRLLVNFRAVPEMVQPLLPNPFRPKLHRGHAILGICLIRLEGIRPAGVPAFMGISSENAAHRIAVEWTDESGVEREGVFIARRDTGSWLNVVAGGRVFPGEHHLARFRVKDNGRRVEVGMESRDGEVSLRVVGEAAGGLPASSCFASLAEASGFFESGSLGYSMTRDAGRLDGLRLHTVDWRVSGLAVSEVHSSFFGDPRRFPAGSIEFDHTLVMRDVAHEWIQVPAQAASAGQHVAAGDFRPDVQGCPVTSRLRALTPAGEPPRPAANPRRYLHCCPAG
jgi:Uncharacterized conserved protein (COG2071)